MLIADYPTKKACKAAIGQPLRYRETSVFGPEYQANGTLTVCNRPHITGHAREWFGNIEVVDGLIKAVR